MSTHKKQTDNAHQVTLSSSIEGVRWTRRRAAPGGMAGLEIRTRFVGHGAPVKIQLLDKQGRSHGAFDDQIVGNRLDAEVAVPQKADGALIADVKLPKHGLSDTSPALWLTAPVTVKNAEWSTDEARRGDVLTLTTDAKGAPAGTEAEVVIFEHDDDHAHDLITRFPVLVEGEKVEAEWEFEYHEDTDDIPRQEELDRRTDETGDEHGDYKHPEYFFRVDVLGRSAESDLVRFNDWIELALVDREGQPVPNERYFLEQPDGEEKKGTLDEQGKARCEVPPGPSKVLFPDAEATANAESVPAPFGETEAPAADEEKTSSEDDERGGGATDISQKGLEFIAGWESFESNLYNDEGNNATIGFGHLVHKGPINGTEPEEFKSGITRDRGLELFREDVQEFVDAVNRRANAKLNQHQFDALVSFAFNTGPSALDDPSMKQPINGEKADPDGIREAFGMWNKVTNKNDELVVSDGLVKRRAAEADLYNRGDYSGRP
jgi:lysozyme